MKPIVYGWALASGESGLLRRGSELTTLPPVFDRF